MLPSLYQVKRGERARILSRIEVGVPSEGEVTGVGAREGIAGEVTSLAREGQTGRPNSYCS